MNKPKLSELVDCLEMVSGADMGECHGYLDKISGEVIQVIGDELAAAEDGELESYLESYAGITDKSPGQLAPNWRDDEDLEQRHVSAIKAIAADNSGEFICLPDSFDVDDYSIMADFCHSIEDDELREFMTSAIQGSGAFGRFKRLIRKHNIADNWFAFERKAYCKIITDWCELEEIYYIDDSEETKSKGKD